MPANGSNEENSNLSGSDAGNQEIELFQNVPNPFSDLTTINYRLVKAGHVNLRIFSERGDPVETLVDTYQEAGTYKVKWNAEGRHQGVYFYVLVQNEVELAKKMMLIH